MDIAYQKSPAAFSYSTLLVFLSNKPITFESQRERESEGDAICRLKGFRVGGWQRRNALQANKPPPTTQLSAHAALYFNIA